ncbi:AAA family ATPase [Methylocaldum sp. GT1BB]|jgi:ABC-type transport system involved in cytochrome c biogenesis ATPase subunit|uniref:AAA family ATPase n=1 Tax=Methylocaldum sp. GT1BB TaxID=3438963 RepID=UPI003DA017B8
MRLDKLWIKRFKNLSEVEIDFSEGDWVTVVIGWNGTGKSNVLEALVLIFRDLDLGKPKPPFAYKLEYRCRGQRIAIDADPDRIGEPYIIRVYESDPDTMQKSAAPEQVPLFTSAEHNSAAPPGQDIKYSRFRQEKNKYLPNYVFGYYSGPSNRLERHFDEHQKRFYDDLLAGEDSPMRPLFYARPIHSQFVLLAFMLKQDDAVQGFLSDYLGIDPNGGIDSVLFVLHNKPSWAKKKTDPTGKGDKRFWFARGVVQRFLDRLYEISLAPIRLNHKVTLDFRRKETNEHLYLFVRDTESLRTLLNDLPPHEFFKELESTYISELIAEVRIRVKLSKNAGAVEFRELSEGEQQLLTVLGLLRFTAEQESLFLLDEPDTHLNPRWAMDYLEFLEKFVGTDEQTRKSSHVVLTTHNPLAIAALNAKQVQILTREPDSQKVAASRPSIDPRGMGFAGILTSDMFGLPATVDKPTLKLLEDQRKIAAKGESLSEEDKKELEKLNAQLESLGFRFEMRDPVFTEYLKLRHELLEAEVGTEGAGARTLDKSNPRAMELIKRAVERAKERARKEQK